MITWKRHSKPLFQVVAKFEEVGSEQTRVIFQMIFDTAKDCNKVKPFAIDKNEENFDRLEEELRRMT